MDGDRSDFITYAIVFAARFTGVIFSGHFFHHVHTIGHLTEYGMAVVQKRSGYGGDEKLRAIGSWARICHRKDTWGAVTKLRMEFISEFITRAATAGFGWIAALKHETLDHSVKGNIIVVATAGQIKKIGACQWSFRTV